MVREQTDALNNKTVEVQCEEVVRPLVHRLWPGVRQNFLGLPSFLPFGVWHLAFGIWYLVAVVFGIWHLAFGIWRLAFGI